MTGSAQEDVVQAIRKSLPKARRLSPLEWVFGISGLIGTLVSLLTLFFATPSIKDIIGFATLALITISLFAFLVAREMRGLDRYAQAIPHLHFAAHVTRDALRLRSQSAIDNAVAALVSSCAEVFSVTTGRICFVTIKVVEKTSAGRPRVRQFEWDEIGADFPHGVRKFLAGKKEDYDFNDLSHYYSANSILAGEQAYCYISNDVYSDFQRRKYFHPVLFNPTTGALFSEVKKGFRWSDWPLSFRSTLVVPIRAILEDGSTDLLGFLCVDCGSRNSFDPRLAPDLAGAYADHIFALYALSREIGASAQR